MWINETSLTKKVQGEIEMAINKVNFLIFYENSALLGNNTWDKAM